MTRTQDATELADLERFMSVAKSAKKKCVPLPIWDHDITALEKAIAALRAAPQTPDAETENTKLGSSEPLGLHYDGTTMDNQKLHAGPGGGMTTAHPQPQQADGREAVIEECAKVADKEADLLLFTGARLRSFQQATKLHYTEAELHDQAGTAIKSVVEKIRALQPSPTTDPR